MGSFLKFVIQTNIPKSLNAWFFSVLNEHFSPNFEDEIFLRGEIVTSLKSYYLKSIYLIEQEYYFGILEYHLLKENGEI